jgi:hypothetical protein
MPARALIIVTTALLLAAAAPAVAQEEFPEQPRTAPRTDSPMVTKGPCFDTAAASMPDGPGHDHSDPAQHAFSCGVRQEAFLPLTDVLAARPDVMIGESDVKADVAAVAVAYPEAGLLTFDVKNPSKPRFLSWYRGGDCDTLVLDTDCGAYVSLSDDGKLAFLSIQATSPLGNGSFNGGLPITVPGVQVVSLADPANPLLVGFLPSPGVNGVHTANYHRYADGSEYLFLVENSLGIGVARIDRVGPLVALTHVGLIQTDEQHDTFIQDDPLDGRTYLYIAAGNTSGFYVYDVSDPLAPVLKAEWDLAPECHQDWYAHTIDVAIRGGRRYVTMPVETFYFGVQPEAERATCGEVYGNGDRPGVMWIVDATDLSKLGPADAGDGNDPPDPALAANSRKALVATWHNAANAAGGDLKFTPHNQQIVGDRIYLSSYHGGVIVLNAAAAFAGRNERPYEEAVITPNSGRRPIFKPARPAINGAFISKFFAGHPDVWDTNAYKGHVLAYDEHGGMYSLTLDPSAGAAAGPGVTITQTGCRDVRRPTTRIAAVRLTRRGLTLRGTAADKACAGRAGRVARVADAVARRGGRRCAHLVANGRFTRPRSCTSRAFRPATGTARFSYRVRARLPRGRYLITVEAADRAGNLSKSASRAVRLR